MREIWVDGSGKGKICILEDDQPTFLDIIKYRNIHIIEYLAVLFALKRFKVGESGIIYTDNKHVADQINGDKMRKRNWIQRMLRDLCLEEIYNKKLSNIEIRWVPRNENKAGKRLA